MIFISIAFYSLKPLDASKLYRTCLLYTVHKKTTKCIVYCPLNDFLLLKYYLESNFGFINAKIPAASFAAIVDTWVISSSLNFRLSHRDLSIICA